MGDRILIVSRNQEEISASIADLTGSGYTIILLDRWSEELNEMLGLSNACSVILDLASMSHEGPELTERMQKACGGVELIVIAGDETGFLAQEAFTLVTPAEYAEHYANILTSRGVKVNPRPAAQPARHSLQGHLLGLRERPRILVIDDDESARDILKVILTKAHYQVEEAEDARIGLALIKRYCMEGTPIAAVVVDLMMPHIDGFEFMRQLRAGKWAPDTPVVVSSSRNDPDAIARVYEHDVIGYVLKPYQPKLLLSRIAEAVEYAKMMRHESSFQS